MSAQRIIIFIIIILIAGCSSKKPVTDFSDESVIVAVIGNDTLTLADFKETFQTEKFRKADPTKASERKRILDELVRQRLIQRAARDGRISNIPEIKRDVSNFTDEILYGRLLIERVYSPQVPDSLIRDYYSKMSMDLNLQHIFIYHDAYPTFKIKDSDRPKRTPAEARELADSLYKVLQKSPERFEELAELFSDNTTTRSRGGKIGYSSYAKIDPAYRDVLYQAKDNAILAPLESRDGYHIFRIMERKPVKNLPPIAILRPVIISDLIRQLAVHRTDEIQQRTDMLTDSLLKSYEFNVHENRSAWFLKKYNAAKTSKDVAGLFTEDERQAVLAFFKGGQITVDEVVYAMRANKEKVKLDMNKLKTGLRKIAATRVLALDARKNNLVLTDEDRLKVYRFQDRLCADWLINEKVTATIQLNDSLRRKFYEDNADRYRTPDEVNFSEIFGKDPNLINQYHQRIVKEKNFEKIFEEAKNAEGFRCDHTGWVPVKRNQELTLKAWELTEGQVSEPFSWTGGGYSIIKLTGKKPGRQKRFEEVKDQVSKDLYEYQWHTTYNAWIAGLYQQFSVQTFEDNLKPVYEIVIK